MPCLINGIAVVARAEAIEARYPGGVAAFLLSHEDAAACADGQIVAVTMESRAEAWRVVASLEQDGLVPFRDGWAGDLVIVTLPEGPNVLCDWLEVGRATGELAELAPELAIVRHSPCMSGEVAIPRSVMNDFREQMGLQTDPRSADPDPVSMRVEEGEAIPDAASEDGFLGQFQGRAATKRVVPSDPFELEGLDGADEGAPAEWPRHPGARRRAVRDRIDERAFLQAGGDPHELAAARACLRLYQFDDPSPLEAITLPQATLSSDLTESRVRGRPLAIGYLHARYAMLRAMHLSVVAELVAIDEVQLEPGAPCRPRACIRLWRSGMGEWMPMLRGASNAPSAIAAMCERVPHRWFATMRFGMEDDRIATFEIGKDHPPDEQLRKGRWGEER